MKRLLASIAVILLCAPAFSQDFDGPGPGADFSIIPRLEANPSTEGFSLGNSSLYSLIEGNISPQISFLVENHWLSILPGELYQATLRSDYCNWLDMAYISWEPENWRLSAGKDLLLWGNFEMDEYDYDCYFPMVSSIWSCINLYQWNISGSWLPSDKLALSLQMATSPFGERPFASGLYTYSFKTTFTGDIFEGMLSLNALGLERGVYRKMVNAGFRFHAGDFAFTIDYSSAVGDIETCLADGNLCQANIKYEGQKWAATAFFNSDFTKIGNMFNTGAVACWYPVENLRIHAAGGYLFGDIDHCITGSVGLTYTFSFSL